ncbi:hypothetical protein BJ912DRAFT_256028 [Pholiota molesta]|nr:hypothetical protein BJ912DRAFT_256028 [Pholiota molesta]
MAYISTMSAGELLADNINREPLRHPCPSHFDVVRIVQTLLPAMIRFARPLQPTMPSATAHFLCCYTRRARSPSPSPLTCHLDVIVDCRCYGRSNSGDVGWDGQNGMYEAAGSGLATPRGLRIRICMAGYEHCFTAYHPRTPAPHPFPRSSMPSPHRPPTSTRLLSEPRPRAPFAPDGCVPLKSASVDVGGTDPLDCCVAGRERHAPSWKALWALLPLRRTMAIGCGLDEKAIAGHREDERGCRGRRHHSSTTRRQAGAVLFSPAVVLRSNAAYPVSSAHSGDTSWDAEDNYNDIALRTTR